MANESFRRHSIFDDMSIGNLFGVGVGLVVIGLFFVLIDYLLIRLLLRAGASEPETWTVAATLPPETSSEDVRRYKITRAVMTHRFRRGGVVTTLIGLVISLSSGLWMLLR
jgi:hypothetical protein